MGGLSFRFADAVKDFRDTDEGGDFLRYHKRSEFDDRAKSETYLGARVRSDFADSYFDGVASYSDDFGPSQDIGKDALISRAKRYKEDISISYCGSIMQPSDSTGGLSQDTFTFTTPAGEPLSILGTEVASPGECSASASSPSLFIFDAVNCSASYDPSVKSTLVNGEEELTGEITVIPDPGFTGIAQFRLSVFSAAYFEQPDIWVLADRLRGATLIATVTVNVI